MIIFSYVWFECWNVGLLKQAPLHLVADDRATPFVPSLSPYLEYGEPTLKLGGGGATVCHTHHAVTG